MTEKETLTLFNPSIPTELSTIADYLKQQTVKLSSPFSDGRINSSINEDEIIKNLQNKFDIVVPKSRAWYDFAVETKENFYPVNIKITDTTHADNLNCKLGIYYALTGMLPDFPNETNWLSYFEKLKENLGKNKDKDYYFLIVNKTEVKDVFVSTLKTLHKLQPNGNNLPFQCKWDENRKLTNRNFEEAEKFILTAFGESIKLRSEIYFNFKKLFPHYV
jgi:hypothetical protein